MSAERGPPNVAGSILLDQMRVMRELLGQQRYDAGLRRLPDEVQETFRHLMPISWLPVKNAELLFDAMALEADQSTAVFHKTVVESGIDRTLRTLWRVFLRFTSDEALVTRTGAIFNKGFDGARLTSTIERPGVAEAKLEGWPNVPDIHMHGIGITMQRVLLCAGRKNPSYRAERTRTGAHYQLRWSP
jgi:hypothetical protein